MQQAYQLHVAPAHDLSNQNPQVSWFPQMHTQHRGAQVLHGPTPLGIRG